MTPTARVEAAAALLGIAPNELAAKLATGPAPVARDRLLRRREAAEILGCSPRTIDGMLASGKLPRTVITPPHARGDGRVAGGRIGISLRAVEKLMAATTAAHQ